MNISIYVSSHGVHLNLFSEQRVLGKRPGKRPGPDGFHQFCQYPQAICRLDIYIYILGPGELGFSCSRQLGYPWGGFLTLVLPRLKLYFFNGSSRDVIGVTYASRSYLMFFPNMHKEPQVTHHANFKSRERHDRADYMS